MSHGLGREKGLEQARRVGVDIRVKSRVEKLVVENGRVVGVELASGATLRADRAVVLASGDYSSSAEWKARFQTEASPEQQAGFAAAQPKDH